MDFSSNLNKHTNNGDKSNVMTIPEIMAQKGPKVTKIMSNLTNVVELKKRILEEMERKYVETREIISKLVAENDKLLQSYYEETKEMSFGIREHFQWICNDHEMINLKLERQEKELKLRSIELQKREIDNKNKRRKLTKEIEEKTAKNNLLQSKEKLMKLADDHKREMEKLHEKILLLEKQLESGKQDVFLEVKRLVEQLTVMNHGRDVEALKKIEDAIRTNLKGMEAELESVVFCNEHLVEKEDLNSNELKGAREELIKFLKQAPTTGHIGLKKIGELDFKPFNIAMRRKYNETEAKDRALDIYILWEKCLQDPTWHPFKVIEINGTHQEVVDENDERLKSLKQELGEEVTTAVTTALTEINNFDPKERCKKEELWNFAEARKATLKETVSYLLETWNAKKKKKRA